MLVGGVSDVYLIILAVVIGLLHFIPMFFESKKSTVVGRFLTTIYGVWMWTSLMLLIDIVVIYTLGMFVKLPFEIILGLILIVPILAIYNFYNAHKFVINEKTLKLDNIERDIDIVHLSDVHFGSVHHKKLIQSLANKLKDLKNTCELAIISGDFADGSSYAEGD